MDNRTPYASDIEINVDGGNACSLSQLVAPETTRKVRVVFTELSCWGEKPISLDVLSALGTWQCDWAEAKSHEPLVITEDSPGCTYSSYKPGILRQPPTTGGPPFGSPPQ